MLNWESGVLYIGDGHAKGVRGVITSSKNQKVASVTP